MTNYHRPLPKSGDRTKMFAQAIALDEGCISVGGLAAKTGLLKPEPQGQEIVTTPEGSLPGYGSAAIIKLLVLYRQEQNLTQEAFAHQARITLQEVQAIENATKVPEPRVLHALSTALDISYNKLLLLAGHRKQRDKKLERETLRFAALSGSMEGMSRSSAEALHDMLRILHE